MARTRAPDHDQQRDRILNAAVRAFAEVGYPSASMSQLAAACGVSKAGLYHYYASKDLLLYDALDRYTRRLLELAGSAPATVTSPAGTLRALIRSFMSEYRSAQAYHSALLNDVKFLGPTQRDQIRAQEREVVEIFARTIASAYPAAAASGRLMPTTMALLGMINFTFAWLDPDGPMNDRQFADLVIELWERGLAGLPAATGASPNESGVVPAITGVVPAAH